ncbi:MAG: LacI family transcriptional regulator [Mariniblastus sp.]|jgi:LacI family transcriptional regulator
MPHSVAFDMNQKITIQDIANQANVSKATVSRVLNNSSPVDEKKRSAVMKAMKKLDFKPNLFARTLAGGRSMTLGIVTQNIGSPFYDSVTQGVTKELSTTEYSPIIADGQWSQDLEKEAIATLVDRQVDGLIMVGGDLDAEALEEARRNVPTVLVARRLEGWEDRSIQIDNIAAGKMATDFLIESGHRNIAHVTGIQDHQDSIDRTAGYLQSLAEAGIKINESLIIPGNFSGQSGVLAIETLLLRGTPFTAIFAANDEVAMGIRLALFRKGIRVPEDVSIVGFDNQPSSAFMTPPLTTISQPAIEMGQAASRMLVGILKNQAGKLPTFNGELVIRESVTPPR